MGRFLRGEAGGCQLRPASGRPHGNGVAVALKSAQSALGADDRAAEGPSMTSARLSLHVPEPTVRPGGSPDFSHVAIAEAGEVSRPSIDVSPSDIRNFAYTMIRALDDNCEA